MQHVPGAGQAAGLVHNGAVLHHTTAFTCSQPATWRSPAASARTGRGPWPRPRCRPQSQSTPVSRWGVQRVTYDTCWLSRAGFEAANVWVRTGPPATRVAAAIRLRSADMLMLLPGSQRTCMQASAAAASTTSCQTSSPACPHARNLHHAAKCAQRQCHIQQPHAPCDPACASCGSRLLSRSVPVHHVQQIAAHTPLKPTLKLRR